MIRIVQRDRRYVAAIAALTLVALVRVASAHRVFSEVLDEPAHLAAGFQWLHGTYTIDASHPPLARILGALPLRLARFSVPQSDQMLEYGAQLLDHGNRYQKVLARIRIGNLLLFAAAIVSTAEWARRTFSRSVAIAAAALLTTIPAVLGHAGVLTTDLAAMTGIALSMLALDAFIEAPTTKRAALLGVAIGIGLLTKFSFLVFFPPCALIVILSRARRDSGAAALRTAGLVLLAAFLTFWAGYRFDFRTPKAYNGPHATYVFEVAAPKPLQPFAMWAAEHLPIPAPAFAVGLGMLQAHNKEGHKSWLLGKVSWSGWWYYFPVVFFFKTPLAFLVLAIAGTAILARRGEPIAWIAPAMLASAMTTRINIGVRHILPMYPLLAIAAAVAVVVLWKRSKAVTAALLLWFFLVTALAHPNYLAYFNEAAGREPVWIVADSNLDWGQDLLRLADLAQREKLEPLHVSYFGSTAFYAHIPWAKRLEPGVCTPGWVAVSETRRVMDDRGRYDWLQQLPYMKVGSSFRLYNVPPGVCGGATLDPRGQH